MFKKPPGRDGLDWRGSEAYENPKLTPQERKCVEMARNNFTNDEIADEMEIDYRTAADHLHNAKKKGVEFPSGHHRSELYKPPSAQKIRVRNAGSKVGIERYNRNMAVIRMLDAGEKSPTKILAALSKDHPTLTEGMVNGLVYRYNCKKEGVNPHVRAEANKRKLRGTDEEKV